MIARQPLTGRARTIVLALIGAVLFWFFVWPTPYVYLTVPASAAGPPGVVRVNRWTGTLRIATDDGWK